MPLFLLLLLAQSQLDNASKHIDTGNTKAALETLKTLRCDNQPCEARKLALTGSAHLYEANYEAALNNFHTAREIYTQLNDLPRVIDLYNNEGSVHLFRGEYAESNSHYQQALKLTNQNKQAPWFQSTLQFTTVNLATLYQKLGRNREALNLYNSTQSNLAPQEQAQSLSNRATLLRRLGDPYKCKQLLEEALALLKNSPQQDTRLGILKNLGIVLALDFNDYPAAARYFDQVLTTADKSRDARESLQARLYSAELAYRSGNHPLAKQLWQQSLTLSQQSKSPEEEWRSLYGLARISRNRDQARSALASIEQLRSGIGTTTLKSDFLADKSEVFDFALALDFEANDPTSAFHTIERSRALALREALPTKPTLLTLQQFQSRLTKDEAALRLEVGKTESYALWITPTTTHLERLPITEKQASNPNPAILFRNALWPAKRLWIIPDGPLALIPLEPLFPKLIETAYLPAAWFLEAPKLATKHIHFPWQLEVAAYSSPTINTQNLLPGDEILAPLPNSTKEVEAIARILPGHANLYTQATLSQLATAPILHLATHAIADPESAQRNRILLGNTYLYATQLKPNSLPNTELAVLSACDTSLGPQLRGEGVQSLSRAFLAAGANATIASYWKVDDRSTRILMETLYRNLTQGLSYSEALHQTRLTLQKQNSDPRIWAAFTVQGAARDTLPRFISWPQLLSAAAAMLALTAYVFNKLRAPQAQ